MNKLSYSLLLKRTARVRYLLAACCVAAASLTSCEDEGGTLFPNPRAIIQPKGPAPAFAPTIDPQMLAVIEQFQSYGTPPLPTLSPRQARMTPTITDAVQDLLNTVGTRLIAAGAPGARALGWRQCIPAAINHPWSLLVRWRPSRGLDLATVVMCPLGLRRCTFRWLVTAM